MGQRPWFNTGHPLVPDWISCISPQS